LTEVSSNGDITSKGDDFGLGILTNLRALVSFSESVHCDCLGKGGSSIPGNIGEWVRVLGVFGGELGGEFCGGSLANLRALVSFSESVHCKCLGKGGSSIPGNVGEGVRVLGVFGVEFGGDFWGEDGSLVFEGILRSPSTFFGEVGWLVFTATFLSPSYNCGEVEEVKAIAFLASF